MKKMKIDRAKEAGKSTPYHHGDLKTALLESAKEELSEKGIESFSLRGVAKRAGVSHAAPTHHFGDTKGLLTALAELGFKRFLQSQDKRKSKAQGDPKEQLAALGLGYIDFAIENPSLFRLMFSSEKTDSANHELETTSGVAFNKLQENVLNVKSADPQTHNLKMSDVMSTWAIVHGLADLLIGTPSSLTKYFKNMSKIERERVLSDMILRACGAEVGK